jgi:hypothetical protein
LVVTTVITIHRIPRFILEGYWPENKKSRSAAGVVSTNRRIHLPLKEAGDEFGKAFGASQIQWRRVYSAFFLRIQSFGLD